MLSGSFGPFNTEGFRAIIKFFAGLIVAGVLIIGGSVLFGIGYLIYRIFT